MPLPANFSGQGKSTNPVASPRNRPFTISVIIFLVAIAMVAFVASRGVPVVVETNLEEIPMEIAGYKAREDFFSETVYRALNAQVHVYRHYRSDEGKQIDMYIGYYSTARGGRTGHNPNACFSGAGWDFIDIHKIKLKASYCPDGAWVNYLLVRKGNIYEAVLHWYQSAGTKVLGSGFMQNVQRFIGRTIYNRNDGAFIRLSVTTNKEGVTEANLLLKEFGERILELLPKYWPVEQ